MSPHIVAIDRTLHWEILDHDLLRVMHILDSIGLRLRYPERAELEGGQLPLPTFEERDEDQ